MSLRHYIEIARPSHWFKNVFMLPGSVAALMLGATLQPRLAWALPVGIAAACLAASANYVINEWLDARHDAHHPQKSARPSVRREVTLAGVAGEYSGLTLASLVLAALLSRPFALAIGWLLLMGLAYNVPPVRTKERAYLDVLSESVNNMIRFLLGWLIFAPASLPPSSIMLGYWMGGAFLMAVKRLAELRLIGDRERAARYRSSFAHYNEERLLVSILFYAMLSLFFVGVFLVKYRIELVLSIPLLCGLFCWYLALGLREDSVAQRPEHLYRELPLLLYILVTLGAMLFLTVVRIPVLHRLLEITTLAAP